MKRLSLLLAVILLALTLTPALAQAPEGESYVVQAGDWLSKIAERVFGDPMAYPAIVDATNAKAAEDASYATIDNPDWILVGQQIWIPASGEAVASPGTGQDQKEPVTATEVITYVPSPEAVTEAPQRGSCFSNAVGLGRDDAWRCTNENNAIYDPCFEVESQMICNADPISGQGGFVLELTEPLPEPQVEQVDRAWLVELEDGTVCGLLTGTVPGVGDLTAPYGCKGGTYLLGELQPGQVWHADQAVISVGDDGYKLESSETVPVRTVWK